MKLINFPNTLTCCNLISGCIATCFAFFHSPDLALLWIIIGAVFDFFDGMSARLFHVSSPIGKELDSLADDVTFGVAPSTIIFSQLLVMNFPSFLGVVTDYIPFVAYIMAAFSALRLAKFNLDERQSMGFIGLPACQCSVLGLTDPLSWQLAQHAPGRCRYRHSADAYQLMVAHLRDSDVCIEVQALGLER